MGGAVPRRAVRQRLADVHRDRRAGSRDLHAPGRRHGQRSVRGCPNRRAGDGDDRRQRSVAGRAARTARHLARARGRRPEHRDHAVPDAPDRGAHAAVQQHAGEQPRRDSAHAATGPPPALARHARPRRGMAGPRDLPRGGRLPVRPPRFGVPGTGRPPAVRERTAGSRRRECGDLRRAGPVRLDAVPRPWLDQDRPVDAGPGRGLRPDHAVDRGPAGLRLRDRRDRRVRRAAVAQRRGADGVAWRTGAPGDGARGMVPADPGAAHRGASCAGTGAPGRQGPGGRLRDGRRGTRVRADPDPVHDRRTPCVVAPLALAGPVGSRHPAVRARDPVPGQ